MNSESLGVTKNKVFSTFFIFFKVFVSIINFIPALQIFVLGFGLNLILFIFGVGGSKLQDTSGIISTIGFSSILSLIPLMIAVVAFVLSIICCIKFFEKNYSKVLDLILCVLLFIVNVFYMIVWFHGSRIYLALVLLLIIVANMFFVVKQLKS